MMGGGGVLCDREACGNAVTLGGGKGKPQTCPGGIREGSTGKATRPIAKLKCLYTNAHSMEISRRNWKQWCSWKSTILLLSQKHGGMTHVTGIP